MAVEIPETNTTYISKAEFFGMLNLVCHRCSAQLCSDNATWGLEAATHFLPCLPPLLERGGKSGGKERSFFEQHLRSFGAL